MVAYYVPQRALDCRPGLGGLNQVYICFIILEGGYKLNKQWNHGLEEEREKGLTLVPPPNLVLMLMSQMRSIVSRLVQFTIFFPDASIQCSTYTHRSGVVGSRHRHPHTAYPSCQEQNRSGSVMPPCFPIPHCLGC